MRVDNKLWIAQGEDNPCYLLLDQANRHGIIAGASGTGKTTTMKQIAQGFSQAGVPVFLADAKGDVSGLAEPGTMSEKLQKAIDAIGIPDWTFEGCPCRFWTMLGGRGIPVRITVSDMGPTLLAQLLGLSDAQEGVLNIVFRVADDNNMLLIDLKDLRAMLTYVAEHADEYRNTYGNVTAQSVGTIQRALIAVEDQGGELFFGEPNLDMNDWFACDSAGYGYVNILDATKLINSPKVYSMFLLWMMSELFETLPEEGDLEKPKLVFFFDEAHLLFNGMPKVLLDKIVQVVKLIRSKGVGLYFITQSPSDIPDEVLAQLSNRVQHGLRAYTPAEQKAVRAAAQSFRENPKFDCVDAINELGTGEALVLCLDEDGRPSVVEKARILACQCSFGEASDGAMNAALASGDLLMHKYGDAVDRWSAFEEISEQWKAAEIAEQTAQAEAERLLQEAEAAKAAAAAAKEAERLRKEEEKRQKELEREYERLMKEQERQRKEQEREAEKRRKEQERMIKEIARTIGSAAKSGTRRTTSSRRSSSNTAGDLLGEVGGQIMRGIFGNLLR